MLSTTHHPYQHRSESLVFALIAGAAATPADIATSEGVASNLTEAIITPASVTTPDATAAVAPVDPSVANPVPVTLEGRDRNSASNRVFPSTQLNAGCGHVDWSSDSSKNSDICTQPQNV